MTFTHKAISSTLLKNTGMDIHTNRTSSSPSPPPHILMIRWTWDPKLPTFASFDDDGVTVVVDCDGAASYSMSGLLYLCLRT